MIDEELEYSDRYHKAEDAKRLLKEQGYKGVRLIDSKDGCYTFEYRIGPVTKNIVCVKDEHIYPAPMQ